MSSSDNSSPALTALVLAASRQGLDDPVARLQNKSHKCLVTVDGIAMIERVVQTLLDSKCFKHILISIESEKVLAALPATRRWLEDGTIKVIASSGNLADSLVNVSKMSEQPLPLVITTADNALHTAELVCDFVAGFERGSTDVAVALTRESTVRAAYPDGEFGFFQFRDGGYSFCNLYAVRTAAGIESAKIFRTGGQFRKRPWRILRIFGVLPLILYKWRLLNLDNFIQRIAARLGITVDTVILPYAFAPIDVDNPKTFAFSERILRERRDLSA